MNAELIKEMQAKGLITFRKPRICLLVTKVKAGCSREQLRSILLIQSLYIPFPPLESNDFEVN